MSSKENENQNEETLEEDLFDHGKIQEVTITEKEEIELNEVENWKTNSNPEETKLELEQNLIEKKDAEETFNSQAIHFSVS